jgi:hypothetical protein
MLHKDYENKYSVEKNLLVVSLKWQLFGGKPPIVVFVASGDDVLFDNTWYWKAIWTKAGGSV